MFLLLFGLTSWPAASLIPVMLLIQDVRYLSELCRNQFSASLLTRQLLTALTMILLLYFAERTEQILPCAMVSQIWVVPMLAWLTVKDTTKAGKWQVCGVMTAMLAKPVCESPLLHGVLFCFPMPQGLRSD